MNFNNSQSLRNNQSTGSVNANAQYEPFMLGNGYGVGRSPSASGFGQMGSGGQRGDSVRDCMYWPGHLPAQQRGNFTQIGQNSFMPVSGYPQAQQQQQPAKAFVSYSNRNGQGEAHPMNIPCQIAPAGTNPASLIKPMEAVTLRVTAQMPRGEGASGPMVFTIPPEQLYSMGAGAGRSRSRRS